MDFEIRNMDASDIPGLKALVRKEWFSQYNMPEDFLVKALDAYVTMYTCRATAAYAFVTGGKVTGYLLGYASGEDRVLPGPAPDIDSIEGPMADLCRNILAADGRMLESCKDRGFDSELLLFIVDSECRGMRIGFRLLERFAKDSVATGHKLMYLFTDDYCNMGFYDRIGCKVAAKDTVFSDGSDHTFVMLELDLVKFVQG